MGAGAFMGIAPAHSGKLLNGQKTARNLHRLACDTQAALFCESEPPLRVAHMPLPKSSVARPSPSIIFVISCCILRTPSHSRSTTHSVNRWIPGRRSGDDWPCDHRQNNKNDCAPAKFESF
jgi:hypothetical protein